MTGAETEDDIPLGERKTVTDFCYLLDKSKQLFNGLRSVCLVSAEPLSSEGHYSTAGVLECDCDGSEKVSSD